MKNWIFVSLFLFSLNSNASWFTHKNCEIFISAKNAKDFLGSNNIPTDELTIKAKESGYYAIAYINNSIENNVPMSANISEEILELELSQTYNKEKHEIVTKHNFFNNIKDENGKVKKRYLIHWFVITTKKKFYQKLKFRKRKDALEIIDQLPECILARTSN